jgi:large subunit ribosomal protein L25
MAVIAMKGLRRESIGKGGARKTRAAGSIPGVIYGHGETPVPVAISKRDFDLALHTHKGGNAIVNLALESGTEYTALIRDVQYDPVTHSILHLDFQHISLTETVEVDVSTHLIGIPLGVKDGGGILEHITRTIKVRCLPTAIPTSIDLDAVVPNAEILSDLDATIAVVVSPTVEDVPVEAAVTEVTEPEVITAKKTEGDEKAEKTDKPDKKSEKKKEEK